MNNEKTNIESTKFDSWEERNRVRANERYHSIMEQNAQIKKAESLLAHLGDLWGFDTPIPESEFEKLKFPYLVCTGGSFRGNDFAFVVGKYLYMYFENYTFKIYKNE